MHIVERRTMRYADSAYMFNQQADYRIMTPVDLTPPWSHLAANRGVKSIAAAPAIGLKANTLVVMV